MRNGPKKTHRHSLRIAFSFICVLTLFLLPYATWGEWPPALSTAGLCVTGWVLLEGRAESSMGLAMSWNGLMRTVVLFLVLAGVFHVVHLVLYDVHGLEKAGSARHAIFHSPFLALNEEVVLGWLPLLYLQRRGAGIHRSVWFLALVFAGAHLAFYRLGMYRAWLSPLTLCTLMSAGVLRHYAIWVTGHVGYAWAMHAAWNLWFLDGRVIYDSTGQSLDEPMLFNTILGQPALALTALGLAFASAVLVKLAKGKSRFP